MYSPLRFVLSLVFLASLCAALTWRGADFSSLANLEGGGLRYKDGGSTVPFETILRNHGANIARIRIWTSTSNSQYSLNYGLALAKRAQAAGLSIYVDLHYSDTWADPGHQSIPSSWPKDLAGLNTQIWTYTRDVVNAFTNQGTPITMIQIGNEINDGMLWPVGRISTSGFSPLSQLLHSAANGVRAASSSVRIMVHLADGWDTGTINWFYGGIFLQGQFAHEDVDILGFSFYPFYNTRATYANLANGLQAAVSLVGKDVMVVETDWPATSTCSATMSESSIARSVSGQQTWVNGIRNVLQNVPSGRGIGIVYWEPGWVGNANLGSGCADNLLVDGSGNTRSSIAMFSANM
ncbi:glycoside hydrolase family 53 protein [Pleurotus ostreatus PC15]|uniref:Arabinogalactan endo-beta-1,4-galactanase n=1 Tax=Pleurotus ostreatus (strain PC15) TaxID=1137138 RepID=A0A067P685_PLEO1|nr:glycoside hydrolase family 53 protein [Pleurotus ostreatus PC15]